MFDFYQTLIDEHRETLDMDNSRDLIDVYLIEIEKAKTEGRAGELFEGRDHGKQIDIGYTIFLKLINNFENMLIVKTFLFQNCN